MKLNGRLVGLLLLPVTLMISGCSGRQALDAMKKAADAVNLIDIKHWAFIESGAATILNFWWHQPAVPAIGIGWLPATLALGCLLAVCWKVAIQEKREYHWLFFLLLISFPDFILESFREVAWRLWPAGFNYAYLVKVLGWAMVEKVLNLDIRGLIDNAMTFGPVFAMLQFAVIFQRFYGGAILATVRLALVFAILLGSWRLLIPSLVALFCWWLWAPLEYSLIRGIVEGIFAGSGVAFIIVTVLTLGVQVVAPLFALNKVAREYWERRPDFGGLVDLVQTLVLLRLGREPREPEARLPVPVREPGGGGGWRIYRPPEGPGGGPLPPLAPYQRPGEIEGGGELPALPPPRGESGDVIHLGPSRGDGGPGGAGGSGGGARGPGETRGGGTLPALAAPGERAATGGDEPARSRKGAFGETVGAAAAIAVGLPALAAPASKLGRVAAEGPSLADRISEIAQTPGEAITGGGQPLPPLADQEPVAFEETESDVSEALTNSAWGGPRAEYIARVPITAKVGGKPVVVYSQGERIRRPFEVDEKRGIILERYGRIIPWSDIITRKGGE